VTSPALNLTKHESQGHATIESGVTKQEATEEKSAGSKLKVAPGPPGQGKESALQLNEEQHLN